ncbi:MAG: response regulator [Chthoniobacterales bacterium]
METSTGLPCELAPHGAGTVNADAVQSEAPLILMVDDDATLQMLFERYLTAFGYRSLFAADGKEALSLASKNPDIRVIILDLMMPGLTARELAARLAASLPHAVFVFCSGHPENTLARLGIDMKDAHFMQKPCRPMELQRRLSEILAIPA